MNPSPYQPMYAITLRVAGRLRSYDRGNQVMAGAVLPTTGMAGMVQVE